MAIVKPIAMKRCPSCGARLPDDAARCDCGWFFPFAELLVHRIDRFDFTSPSSHRTKTRRPTEASRLPAKKPR
jgi:hypothetical protein